MSKKDKVVQAKLIANPGAGKLEASPKQLELATRFLQQHNIKVDVALAKPKEEATPLAKQAVKDGYKIVIALGGDGTLEAVLRGLVGSKARLGIIPTGSKNNMAKSLGIPESLEEACNLIASKNTRKLDVGKVKVKNRKKLYFFELTAIGLVAALYPKANKLVDGKLSNLKDIALTLINHQPDPKVYLTLDDESKIEVKAAPKMDVMADGVMLGKGKVEIKSCPGSLWIITPKESAAPAILEKDAYEELPPPVAPVPEKTPSG